MGKVATGSEPELGKVAISVPGDKLSKVMGSIRPRAHKGVKGKGFRSNTGENIKGVSGDGIGEVRDDCNAILTIRSLIPRCINERSGKRKSRGRFRT